MPQITLQPADVVRLSEFLRKHDLKTFFMAKDHGAYVGACGGSHEDGTFENILFHFKGMNPKIDPEYYDTAWHAFGGDDFGVDLSADFIHKMAAHGAKVRVMVTQTQVKMEGIRPRRAA